MKTNKKKDILIKSNHNSRNGTQRFVDKEFANILDEIKKTRVMIGKDGIDSIKADWRITLAMARHPDMKKKIMEDIINADLVNN